MPMMRTCRFLLVPILLLGLAGGCSKHSSSTSSSAPAITVQPVNATTVTGREVSLTVTATGQATLTYQWAKDGLDILGAENATLTLYNPSALDSGTYTVTVTNDLGSITSAPTTLTVTPAVTFLAPAGVVADASGDLFVSDMEDQTIWKVDATNHKTLLAGASGLAGATDGQGAAARFNHPGGLALDASGNLVVADTGNDTIRRIAPDGTVTTLAGSPGLPGSADGVGAQAQFSGPYGIAVDSTSGTIYISDSQNHTIRTLATDGTVATYAGTAGSSGTADGTGANARFNQPDGLALGSDGTLYVADYGNSSIRKIAPGGVVSTVAGLSGTHGYIDGVGTSAEFYWPVGIAVDASGVLWVADTHNHAIRSIGTNSAAITVAGTGGTSGNADGSGTAALFDLPCGIAVTPSGALVVADTGNHLLRVVTTSGVVTTYLAP